MNSAHTYSNNNDNGSNNSNKKKWIGRRSECKLTRRV